MNRYGSILSSIFAAKHQKGSKGFDFTRDDIRSAAAKLSIDLPKNIGDLIYSFRYRADLPADIAATAPAGLQWIIRPGGRGLYRFALAKNIRIVPSECRVPVKIPDATPGAVTMYSKRDEQALLTKIRYNRLVDLFTGLVCYSLQNHLRTTVEDIGQIETDEVYIGVGRTGVHCAIPVQAKGNSDQLSVVQIEQDIAMCRERFPGLVCRPIGAQFLPDGAIVLFEFQEHENTAAPCAEEHYLLVPPSVLSDDELRQYRKRLDAPAAASQRAKK
jgi:hypothetical protein